MELKMENKTMDHLKMHSLNKIDENIAKIAQLFPNCVTEAKDENGELTHKIDFDMLKQELSYSLVEGREERYQFTWPDKRQAILTANAPINKTLRPRREESVNFDETENLYIEGDNLEVLKLLQETYLGKIKMIYIDPPYNTGNDFVYEDNFAQNAADYVANSGQTDNEGNRLVANTESNGRFHTDWLNMIYPRLKLARDLLTDDGVIFISIDDNEVDNLKKVCNEIFGETNFVAQIIWLKKYGIQNDAKYLSVSHDYILLFAKNIINFKPNLLPRTEEQDSRYKNPDNDPRGDWKAADFTVPHSSENRQFEITLPSGRKVKPAKGRSWGASEEELKELIKDNRIWFGKDGDNIPCLKKFLTEVKNGVTPTTFWHYDEVSHTDKAKKDLTKLMDNTIVFDYPKPIELVKKCLQIATNEESIVLDFFGGSSTTAHSVLQYNANENSKRKFIIVQLPENCAEKSEAFKAGYKNICEIGKERIRRAGKLIKEENPLTTNELDIGFRVLKCDTTNMEDVYYTPDRIDTNDLFKNNIKSDRTGEDLLFQTMLDLGIMLSSKIETKKINSKEVFCVEGNYLMACFDDSVDEKTITEIAKEKPYYFVMRDPANSKDGDSLITNFEQIFTTYSPDTVRKIL